MKDLPSTCGCGKDFDINHALNCAVGGYVIIRHNEVRNFEANLLRKVCNDTQIEPPLQSLSNEVVTSLTGDGCRPDIRARGFWRDGQNAFFDVKVSNINSETYKNTSIKKVFQQHEREKRRKYNDRVINVEHGTFTPLIYSITGGIGPEAKFYHKLLAHKLSDKNGDRYDNVVNYIRCKLSFLILKMALLCIRGKRTFSKKDSSNVPDDIDFVCLESRLKF